MTDAQHHERVESERQFHNKAFAGDARAGVTKWYLAVRSGQAEQDRMVRDLSRHKIVLEYGCAQGDLALKELRLPELVKELHGIDISDYAINKACETARIMGYELNCHFHVMNAESMTFPDKMFDLVFGRGILHHLNLEACFAEIARVLKAGGIAIFYEPMGHNPLLNWYRKRTPDLRTPDEHPLLESDFELARRYFSTVVGRPFGLLTLLAVPLRKIADTDKLMRQLDRLDRALFIIPLVRRYAWYSLLTFSK